MKVFIKTIPLWALVTFFACRPKPIDIEVNQASVKLVVSSRIIPNSIMVIALTRSFSALEHKGQADSISAGFLDSVLVSNAIVTVSYMGKTDTLYMIRPGIYGSINTLQYNYGSYSLHVKDIYTGLEATATTTLLPLVPFDTVRPYLVKNPGDTTAYLHYELTDDPAIENYYVVNYVKKLNSSNSNPLDIGQIFSNGNNAFQTYFDLLNDDSFSNGKYSLDKKLEGVNSRDSIAVSVSNISRGYYEFLSAYKRSGSLINQLTGEPINYPSNVENGYGFFNAHYPSIKVFDMKQY